MKSYLDVAKTAAKKAGDMVLKKYYKKEVSIEKKSDTSLVTEADKASEKIILEEIKKHFPDHAIVSEESPPSGSSDFKWFIDPIDGTTNFIRGSDHWCVSIGLCKGDHPLAAAIYVPARNEFFWAEVGKGAFLNGKRIQVSKNNDQDNSIMAIARSRTPDAMKRAGVYFQKTESKSYIPRMLGSFAYELCGLAMGEFDIIVSIKPHSWDIAAGILIALEAGAYCQVTRKSSDFLEDDMVIANNEGNAKKLIALIKS